jgi:hypothetical protein
MSEHDRKNRFSLESAAMIVSFVVPFIVLGWAISLRHPHPLVIASLAFFIEAVILLSCFFWKTKKTGLKIAASDRAILIGILVCITLAFASWPIPYGPPPYYQADLSIQARDLDGENVLITIIHNGGDRIPPTILVAAERGNGELVEIRWVEALFPGDVIELVYTYGPNPKGKTIEVRMMYGLQELVREIQIK